MKQKQLTFHELEIIINKYYPNIPPKSDLSKMMYGGFKMSDASDYLKGFFNNIFDNIGSSLFDINDFIVKSREASQQQQQQPSSSDYYKETSEIPGIDKNGNLTDEGINNLRNMDPNDRRGYFNNALDSMAQSRGYTYDPQSFNYYSDLSTRLFNIKFELENRGVI